MMVNLFDYEMLARQKSESMLAEAAQRRMLALPFLRAQTGEVQGLFGLLRARLGGARRATVATRTA